MTRTVAARQFRRGAIAGEASLRLLRTARFEIGYRAAGEDGPLVLLVHASASSPSQWRALFRAVAERGTRMRMIAPALLGYGGSRRLDGRPSHARDDAALLDEFLTATSPGAPVHLVGHSYGGATALSVALSRPERIASLTLVEPACFGLLTRSGADRERSEISGFASAQIARVAAGELRDAAHDFVAFWSGEAAWKALSPSRRAGVAAAMPKVAGEWATILDAPIDTARLRDLAPPVHLMSGGRTRPVADAVIAVLRALDPRATHDIVARADHMAPLSDPEAFNAAFLAHMRKWLD